MRSVNLGEVHYRILYFFYFFYGNLATVGSRVIAKEQRVSRRQVERAIQWKNKFTPNPTRYTFGSELSY